MPNINPPQTVEDTEHAFYDAIARADIDALMALWADTEDIVCIHPGAPRLVGHASIRASWESIFERGGVHIRPVQVHTSANDMTVVRNVIEEVRRNSTQRPDIHILATNIYTKTERGWRLVTHHTSIVPGEAPPDTSVAALLH